MVVPIGDVEVVRVVHSHAGGIPEPGLGRRAHNCGDRPRGIDLENPVVQGLGDVEVTRVVHRHAGGAADPIFEFQAARNRGNRPVESTLKTRPRPESAM